MLDFQVLRLGDRPHAGEPERIWINQRDYEQLWREGRMRTEQTTDSADSHGSEDGTSAPADEAGALGQRPAAAQPDEQRLAAARTGATTAAKTDEQRITGRIEDDSGGRE
jgi:hypothetical protein